MNASFPVAGLRDRGEDHRVAEPDHPADPETDPRREDDRRRDGRDPEALAAPGLGDGPAGPVGIAGAPVAVGLDRCHDAPAAAVACCGVVVKVAAIAAPAPFLVTVTGLVRPKCWQPRLAKDVFSLFAM